jgi:hypothetical protein
VSTPAAGINHATNFEWHTGETKSGKGTDYCLLLLTFVPFVHILLLCGPQGANPH